MTDTQSSNQNSYVAQAVESLLHGAKPAETQQPVATNSTNASTSPEAAPAAAAPPVEAVDTYREKFGFSEDELKGITEEWKKKSELYVPKEEYNSLNTKFTEAEKKLSESPFASKLVETINNLHKTGASKENLLAAVELAGEDLTKKSADERLKLYMKFKYNLPMNLVEAKFNQKYSTEPIDSTLDSPEDIQRKSQLKDLAEADKIMDLREADEFLTKYQTELTNPVDQTEKLIAEAKTAAQTLSSPIQQTFKTLTIPLDSKNGVNLDYTVPQNFLESLPSTIEAYLVTGNEITNNKESQDRFKDYLHRQLWFNHGGEIAQAIYHQASTETEKRIRSEYTNPSARKVEDAPNAGAKLPVDLGDVYKQATGINSN